MLQWRVSLVDEARLMSKNCGLYGPFVHPWVICDLDHEWWYWLGLTPNLSTRALWQPPVLSGSPVSRDISGSHQYCLVSCHPRHLWSECEVGERNENLVYPSPWDIKKSFTCCKILWHGTSGFTSHVKEGVLRIFIALKKIHRLSHARTHNLWVQWQAH
jgi:hypothetical protein